MLTSNQAVPYDFSAKDQIHTLDFKYKAGEIDGDGIQILVKGAKIPAGTEILVNWLYSTEEEYIYEQTAGEIISETELKIYPHQNVLIDSSCAFEIIARRESTWLLKGPTVVVPVVPALIDDEIASEEDENLSVILQLINATRDLNDETLEIEANMRVKNDEYLAANDKYNQDEATRQSTFTSKIAESRTATVNANNAAAAANTAATNANTAKSNADNARVAATNAKTAAEVAMTNANTAKDEAVAASSSANTASGRAETAIADANEAVSSANVAVSNVNSATNAANTSITNANKAMSEVVDARKDISGKTHSKLSDRLKADFISLESKIPANISEALIDVSENVLALEEENSMLLTQLESERQLRKSAEEHALLADWEMDIRIYELEWMLEDAQPQLSSHSLETNSKFEQAKKLIASGAYDEGVLLEQLTKYQAKGVIAKTHLETLIAIMVGGEVNANN